MSSREGGELGAVMGTEGRDSLPSAVVAEALLPKAVPTPLLTET